MTYADAFFIISIIGGIFAAGYGLVLLFGLGIMKGLDRRTGKKRWWIVGRCC